jgi:hypothetical protein
VKFLKWNFSGSTSLVTTDMNIHAGDLAGPIIAIVPVDAIEGTFSFSGKSTASPGSTGIFSLDFGASSVTGVPLKLK